jgi:flagellar hook-length control protein FliK
LDELDVDGIRYFVLRRSLRQYGEPPLTIGIYRRAAEVDASVRLENATGQPASSAPGRAVPVNVAVPSQTPGQSTAPVMAAHASPVATTTPVAGMLDEETFGSRVVRGLTTVVNQRGGVMTMRLEPPELGDLRVQMTLARGLVSAQFQAATPEAHALLEKSMTMLRTALENQGLTVQRLSVHLSPGAQLGADNGGQSSADQGQHHGARHDAAGEESRGRRDELPEHARGRDGAARGFEDHIADREDPTPSDVTVTRAGGPIQ